LCYTVNQEDEPIPDPPETIQCTYNTQVQDYPEPKIFASPDGLGLWEPIAGDYNVLEDVEEGYTVLGDYAGSHYVKYMMRNGNFLIKYIKKPNINDTSKKIDILYYKEKQTGGHTLAAKFINRRHCDVKYDKEPEKRSVIDDSISVSCELTYNGIFQYPAYGETTPPDAVAPSGFYEGYLITSQEWGGLLDRWSDLYYGWFRFNGEDEDPLAETWDEDGFLSGFGKSVLTDDVEESGNKETPQEARAKLELRDYEFMDLTLEDII
jgi:hypothetical protein